MAIERISPRSILHHWLWLAALPLCSCGGSEHEPFETGSADTPGPVTLPVLAGCEQEFYGACSVLDAECQARVFSTAKCLRQMPEAVLPTVRVVSKEALIGELMDANEADDVGASSTDAGAPTEEATGDGAEATGDGAEHASDTEARVLELLGLAQPSELSEESYTQVFIDTVPAFYSNDVQVVTLVDDGEPQGAARSSLTLLHEFVHALQDQDQSLAQLGEAQGSSFDAYLAALSLVEGEAEMLESFVDAAQWGFEQDPNFRTSYTSWVGSAEEQFAGQSPLLIGPRYFPYSYGTRYVFDVFRAQGEAGVRARFASPPPSVLPMLVNDTGPVDVTSESLLDLPEPSAPAGFELDAEDSLGPWVFGKFIESLLSDTAPADRVSHWRGDRLLGWSGGDQGVAALWTVRFDTTQAASLLFEPARQRALAGAPSAHAFCVQSGRNLTFGVTDQASTLAAWHAVAEATPSNESSATSESTPSAGAPNAAAARRLRRVGLDHLPAHGRIRGAGVW